MVKKTIRFDMYIKTSEQTPTYSYVAKQKVMSNDKDSTQITFNLLDVSPDELSGSSASILLYMQDGSFFQSGDVTIDRNSVIYTMKEEETKHSGNTKVQIVLKKGTVQTASLIYNFEIEKGLEKYPITEVMIQDWTTLTEEAKAFVEQIEGFTLEQFIENKMGQELANLEVNYATRLTGLEQKDNQLTAQLAQKVGGGNLAGMGDLSQEVKSAMSGGSVAIVGEGTVTKINLANDLKNKIEEIDMKGNVLISVKNMFNPDDVVHGQAINNLGTVSFNASYKMTPKYPVVAGEEISISGMQGILGGLFNDITLWSGASGSVLGSLLPIPVFPTTDYYSFTVPAGVTYFSINIMGGIVPEKMQIEKSHKPTSYQPYKSLERGISKKELEGAILKKSTKNIYDGKVASRMRVLNNALSETQSDNDNASSFVPVEYGKYYTISGLDPQVIFRNILAYSSNNAARNTYFVKFLTAYTGEKVTVYIDNPDIKYIIFPITSDTTGTYQDAMQNHVQVEEGVIATDYEPHYYMDTAQRTINASAAVMGMRLDKMHPDIISNFVELNKVRNTRSSVGVIEKDIAPLGISYALNGSLDNDSEGNTLFTQYKVDKTGTKQVFVNLAKFVNDKITVGALKGIPFTVPSGQFDNPDTLAYLTTKGNKDDYCHPDIAYDATGVAGYKYWMLSSVLPSGNMGDVVWEDEDVFVSNNGKDWLRIKSLYETEKDYTAPVLSLPPQNLVKNNARKHAFLPNPSNGDTIEISVPADNGAPALDREMITLTELGWKHDPAILIDGGYVYTYHSFHLPYKDRTGGKNRFIVCVRTNDGVNWQVVRRDGSTMALTEESSRQIFTKDAQGRYNYMYYAYSRSYSNPKILKYGNGDYEMVYGYNFTFRVKGTAPYNFDFSTQYPFKDMGNENHPGLLLDGNNLYLINNSKMHVSADRGATFTTYDHYPAWIGGVSGMGYKKTLCKGEDGKVILMDIQRQHANASKKPVFNQFSATTDVHQMFVYEFPSVANLVEKAQNGLVDGYVDILITKVNFDGDSRATRFYPAVSNNATTSIVNRPLQRIKLTDINVEEGDTLFLYVTLNSRNGAKISFGGIEIV